MFYFCIKERGITMEKENNVTILKQKNNKTILKHKLIKAVEYEGKEYEELEFDFAKLTGNDAIAIEEEMEMQGIHIMAPETSRAYQARMAARAGEIPYQLLEMLSFQDFTRITNAARNFLVGQDL